MRRQDIRDTVSRQCYRKTGGVLMITTQLKQAFINKLQDIEQEIIQLTGRYDIDEVSTEELVKRVQEHVSEEIDLHMLEVWVPFFKSSGSISMWALAQVMSDEYMIDSHIVPTYLSDPDPDNMSFVPQVSINGYEIDDPSVQTVEDALELSSAGDEDEKIIRLGEEIYVLRRV